MDKSNLLGSGVYGKVYKVNVGGRDVAVKFIENDGDGMRELGEVNLLKKFDHPNILKRFDELFVLPNEIGITLPLASTDLENAIKAGISGNKKQQWVYELLSGVNFIHRNGYYHCDIKPANVLIINDRAVIADLGLMGLQILKSERCQSIASPQLLYIRSDDSEKLIMTNPIYQKPFTNIQTDLWALGETIYYVANSEYPILNSVDRMNEYVATNTLPIEGEFNSIIKTLLNPDPEELNINLTILLGEEPFNGKHTNYISGTVDNNIINANPVIFTSLLEKQMKILFPWFLGVFKHSRNANIVLFNAIDMFYRIFNIIPDRRQYQLFICACLTISAKIYGEFTYIDYLIDNLFTQEQLSQTERTIVEFLGGVLDRDLPIFYGVDVEKFKKWIVVNPEKYEQFNMANLVREINS